MTNQTSLTPFHRRVATLQEYCQSRRAALEQLIPTLWRSVMTPERIVALTVSAAVRNPLLLECTPSSIWLWVRHAVALGIEPGLPGGMHLVPFHNAKTGKYEAVGIFDYRALIEIALRSERIAHIETGVVREGDVFEYERSYGNGHAPRLRHVPQPDAWPALDGSELRYAYAVAFVKGEQQPIIEVVPRSIVELHRARSRSGRKGEGPWATDTEAMWRKTAVRILYNVLPKTPEMKRVLDSEITVESGRQIFEPDSPIEIDEVQAPAVEVNKADVEESPLKEPQPESAEQTGKIHIESALTTDEFYRKAETWAQLRDYTEAQLRLRVRRAITSVGLNKDIEEMTDEERALVYNRLVS